jgi:hypothetical protein
MTAAALSAVRGAGQRWFALRSYRIRWPEWVVALAAVVLLVALVGLSWFSFTRFSGGAGPKFPVLLSENGWRALSHAHWLLLVTILVAFGLLFCQAARPAAPIPVTFSLLVMVLGGLSTIWLIVRVVIDPPAFVGHDFGGWLALVSAVVLTWAGYKSIRMEGIAPEDAPQEIPTVGLGGHAITSTAEEEPDDEGSSDEDPERGKPS